MQAMMLAESTELDLALLSDDEAARVVDDLKAEADRHYWINANRSLELAEQIVQLGRERGNMSHTALGMMTRGDAMKFLGRTADAWAALGEAGELFQQCGDEVGWARTRIGRLLICVDLGCVQEALADAETARAIFVRHGVREKQVVLDLNTAIVHDLLGDQQRALTLYHDAITLAEALGEAGKPFLGLLYNCTGVAYNTLGSFRDALHYYERAYAVFYERQERSAAALAKQNIAYIAMAHGDYRHALRVLQEVYHLNTAEGLLLNAAHAGYKMVECYLQLNRYNEAKELAYEVAEAFRKLENTYKYADVLFHLATAEAELGNFYAAEEALNTAEAIFMSFDARPLVAMINLGRSSIALHLGNLSVAEREAIIAGKVFQEYSQYIEHARAQLICTQVYLLQHQADRGIGASMLALKVARQENVPNLRYAAHLLLGRIHESQNSLLRAERHYRAAAATVARVQHHLTLTLRPGFLEDKGEAARRLIALYLRDSRATRAFEALERAKSQMLLSYLTDHGQLRWAANDERSRQLVSELDTLRGEHQWLYNKAQELVSETQAADADLQRARAEVAVRERQMRMITEELYLRGGDNGHARVVDSPSLADIQAVVEPDDLLLEFYADEESVWAFAVDRCGITVFSLPVKVADIGRMVQQLQLNFTAALAMSPEASLMRGLTGIAQRILERLYAALLAPLDDLMRARRRLVIVPYGVLHYLPFHLLRRTSYLIEQHEVVVLPAAALITHRGPAREPGALVLAHSWNGRLPHTLAEAQIVQRQFGGKVCREDDARRCILDEKPVQILHIAAHGEYRLDQPELSFIQLDDGQLYTDDLLQHDLSYELVTLSACETGRANVAPGDELIGLGRGFLYAGAGALITSLWSVPDASAAALMEQLYSKLQAGDSKAAALRFAQLTALQTDPQLHPAFWGAFQLIGDPRPLTRAGT
jgi:CHAT domain-containing protein/tetratricopeptide (TPR) repeat protein